MSKKEKTEDEKVVIEEIDVNGNIFSSLTERQYINGIHVLRFNEFEYIYKFLENETNKVERINQFIDYISELRADFPSNTSPYLVTNVELNQDFKLMTINYSNEKGPQFGRGYDGGTVQFIKDIYNKIDQMISNLEAYLFKLQFPDNYEKLSKFEQFGKVRIEDNGDIRFQLLHITLSELSKYFDLVKSKSDYKSKQAIYKLLFKVLIKTDGSPYSKSYFTQSEYNFIKKDSNKEEEILDFLNHLIAIGKKNKTVPTKMTY